MTSFCGSDNDENDYELGHPLYLANVYEGACREG